MISPGNHESGLRELWSEQIESLDHEFETLIRAPFPKGQNTVGGSSTTRKVGEFGSPSKESVGAEMNIVTAILIIQDLAISGHENGHGVRKQKHPRGHSASESIQTFMAHSCVLQFDRIHEVMQGNMGVSSTQARKQRGHEAAESDEWVPAEGAEQQIKPDHIRLQAPNSSDQPIDRGGVVERPAPHYREALPLLKSCWKFIRKYRKAQKRISLQFLRDVESVFAQTSSTGREGCDQTNLH